MISFERKETTACDESQGGILARVIGLNKSLIRWNGVPFQNSNGNGDSDAIGVVTVKEGDVLSFEAHKSAKGDDGNIYKKLQFVVVQRGNDADGDRCRSLPSLGVVVSPLASLTGVIARADTIPCKDDIIVRGKKGKMSSSFTDKGSLPLSEARGLPPAEIVTLTDTTSRKGDNDDNDDMVKDKKEESLNSINDSESLTSPELTMPHFSYTVGEFYTSPTQRTRLSSSTTDRPSPADASEQRVPPVVPLASLDTGQILRMKDEYPPLSFRRALLTLVARAREEGDEGSMPALLRGTVVSRVSL